MNTLRGYLVLSLLIPLKNYKFKFLLFYLFFFFVLSLGNFRGFAANGLYLFKSAANSTPSMITAVLCTDITSAIQQKVDNVILLPKAIEPYPSVHSKSLNHL